YAGYLVYALINAEAF
ncbi:potassium-transporting ATPase subunit F, partial [Escherichia sp. HC-CC]